MIVRAYALGIFPMAPARGSHTVHWVAPAMRGILPLDGFHVPRRLRRTLRQHRYEIRCDTEFPAVVDACAQPRPGHPETWINAAIRRVFCELHAVGYAHTMEVWHAGRLAGGLYGLALGGAFFGESMFSHATDASKIALVHLVARLRRGGFRLLDAQFLTEHLQQFGAIEVPSADYLTLLGEALRADAIFYGALPPDEESAALSELLTQSRTQRS
jgi:leucyl/phenylalanyl-tRNA--protein transferase